MNDYLLIIIIGPLLAIVVCYTLFKFWPRTGKWGINTKAVFCPDCGTKAPMIRMPENPEQALWGGWTCSDCGCEFDKYGKKIDA